VLVMPRLKQVDHVKNEKNILKARRGSSNEGGGAVLPTLGNSFRSVRLKKLGRFEKILFWVNTASLKALNQIM
jgi:hypothetical protein